MFVIALFVIWKVVILMVAGSCGSEVGLEILILRSEFCVSEVVRCWMVLISFILSMVGGCRLLMSWRIFVIVEVVLSSV